MMNWQRIAAFAAVLALWSSSVLFAQQRPAEGGITAIPVATAVVTHAVLNVELTAVGTLRADEQVVIRPEIAGRVAAIHFQEGQSVSQGVPLITLDQEEHRAQLASSAAQLVLEESSFQRLQNLQYRKLASQQDLDEARARLDAARAQQHLNQVRLEKTVLRAPFAGVIGLRQVSPGAYVKPGDELANLISLGTVKVDFRVPEIYLARLAVGQTVTVQVDAYPGQTFTGAIYAIEPGVDEETRTVLVRARLPNTHHQLRPGLFARVRLILERRENALVIPEQALVPLGQKSFVYRVVDHKAVMVPVTLGLRRPGQVEVVTGLNLGDTVVTDGQLKIRDGASVTIIPPPGEQPVRRG